MPDRPPVAELIADLANRLGVPRFVAVCTDLMAGAERERYVDELRSLTGHDLPRVRSQAIRAPAVTGDTEHGPVEPVASQRRLRRFRDRRWRAFLNHRWLRRLRSNRLETSQRCAGTTKV